MTLRASLLAVAAAVAVTLTAPARADTVRVEYGDLDLSSQKGRDTLQRRIREAARELCGLPEDRTGSRTASAAGRKCYASALADINRRFAPLLERAGG